MDREAEIEGFTIGPTVFGTHAGIGVSCQGASPTIRGNVIENHGPGAPSSGIRVTGGSDPFIVGNVIQDNVNTASGGGICLESTAARIERNVIRRNRSIDGVSNRLGGGALYANRSAVVLSNNLIVENEACGGRWNLGAGLLCRESSVTLSGNTLSANVAHGAASGAPSEQGQGGAVFAFAGSTLDFTNSVLSGNTADEGSEIYAHLGSRITVGHSAIDPGTNRIAGEGVVALGPGVLRRDPGFVGGMPFDYHITAVSPVVDAGEASFLGGLDGDLEPRVLDGDLDGNMRIDMGWDEHDPTGLLVIGTPTIGGTLALTTTGPPGWIYSLAWGPDTEDLPLSPFGSLLISSPRPFASGVVPGTENVSIPSEPSLRGFTAYIQALARDPDRMVGSFSRRVCLTLR